MSDDRSTRPIKRSFRIAGHQTSISLEWAFWQALKDAASARDIALARLVADIDAERGATNLSSAVRVWLLQDVQARLPRDVSAPAPKPLSAEEPWSP
jgi:predicted DNA-binding ribbon-helix-helix protein